MLTLIAGFLFVVSSGLLFNDRFRSNWTLVGAAAIIAMLSTYLLFDQVAGLLNKSAEVATSQSEQAEQIRQRTLAFEAERRLEEERRRSLELRTAEDERRRRADEENSPAKKIERAQTSFAAAQVAHDRKERNEEIRLLTVAINLDASNSRYYVVRAIALMCVGQRPEAAKDLQTALRLNPGAKLATDLLDMIRTNRPSTCS